MNTQNPHTAGSCLGLMRPIHSEWHTCVSQHRAPADVTFIFYEFCIITVSSFLQCLCCVLDTHTHLRSVGGRVRFPQPPSSKVLMSEWRPPSTPNRNTNHGNTVIAYLTVPQFSIQTHVSNPQWETERIHLNPAHTELKSSGGKYIYSGTVRCSTK